MFNLLVASCCHGREEDQEPGSPPGGDTDEEAGDQAPPFWGAGDNHGQGERSCE